MFSNTNVAIVSNANLNTTEELPTKGVVFGEYDDGYSVCLGGKVHLQYHDYELTEVTQCDGSCRQRVREVSEEDRERARRFLANPWRDNIPVLEDEAG